MGGGFMVLKAHVISQLPCSLSASCLRMRCKHSATTALELCLPALTLMGGLLSKIMSKPPVTCFLFQVAWVVESLQRDRKVAKTSWVSCLWRIDSKKSQVTSL